MGQFLKCECSCCGQPIEFPSDGIGQTIPCPTCEKPVMLMQKNPKEQKTIRTNLAKLTEETIRARTKNGDTPLHRAAKIGRIYEIPKHLLETKLFLERNYAGETPLHLAAKYGKLDQVPSEFLTKETMSCRKGHRFFRLASGELYPSPNSEIVLNSDDDNETPLHVAVIWGHADQIPKEFLKPEFLSITSGGATVLHALVRPTAWN